MDSRCERAADTLGKGGIFGSFGLFLGEGSRASNVQLISWDPQPRSQMLDVYPVFLKLDWKH